MDVSITSAKKDNWLGIEVESSSAFVRFALLNRIVLPIPGGRMLKLFCWSLAAVREVMIMPEVGNNETNFRNTFT